jgi:cytochrome c55X
VNKFFLIALLSTQLLFLSFSGKANKTTLSVDKPVIQSKEPLLGYQRKQQLIHLVKQDCGSCHGMTLKGGLGPALLPENVKDKPILFLQNTILYGRPGTAMPPWKTILTEQETLWIAKQLQQGINKGINNEQ